MNWNKTSKWGRFAVLMGLLIYVTYEAYMHQILGGGKAASAHALCPFGALESLYTLLFMGTFIQKIYSGTVVLLALTVFIAILFRRSFCGLLCPFGGLQELFAIIGRKIFRKRFIMPMKIDKPLRYLKYVILLITVGMAWRLGTLWMAPYDPYSAYAHITSFSDAIQEDPLAIVGFTLLAITVVGSLLYDRFFCKYLCPMGAFYGILGKLSPTKIQRNEDLCVHCKVCNKACPVNIDVEKATKVTSAECINCNECVLACPKKGALEVKTLNKGIHPVAMLAIVVGLFFGTIFIAQLTGNYKIVPKELKEGQIITLAEVKGYYTIEETAKATGMTMEELYKKLGIPESVSKETMLKAISEKVEGFELDKVKGELEEETSVESTEKAAALESTNKVDVSGIKGRMTIIEAANSLDLEVKEFYKLFKIPESVPAQTQMKSIGDAASGYDFEKVKEELE